MAQAPAVWLQFFNGTLRGQAIVIQDDEITVGHSDANTLELSRTMDPAVSARHARLHWRGRWTIEDLGSDTGTFVNGARIIGQAALNVGDWILFGAGGTVARVGGPGAGKEPWIVFESESTPGAILPYLVGGHRWLVLDGAPRLADKPPGIALDGQHASGNFFCDGQPVETLELRVGAVLRSAPNRPGVRVLAVPIHDGPGSDTIHRWIETRVRRRQRVPWAIAAIACAGALVAIAFAAYVAWSTGTMRKEMHAEKTRTQKLLEELARRDDERERLEAKARDDMKRAVSASAPERAKFQTWQQTYAASIFLIYTETEIKIPGAAPYVMPGYGTGFAVAPDLIVTNKHVAQPDKFDADIALLRKTERGMKIKTRIACWPSGASFLAADGSPNYAAGFNEHDLNNLSTHRAAADDMEERTVASGLGSETIEVHAQGHNDLVLLKLHGAALKVLPLLSDLSKVKPLDPVMALGYPLGAMALERGMADASPSLGTIRFVEDNIAHAASIFPGSSGGPLIDLEGRVLGINTWVMGMSGGRTDPTFGRAIPAEVIQKLLDE